MITVGCITLMQVVAPLVADAQVCNKQSWQDNRYLYHGSLATPLLREKSSLTQFLLHPFWVGSVLVHLQTKTALQKG